MNSAFLEQLFFFCLLIGGILPMLLLSEQALKSFPVDVEKFEKVFDESSAAAKAKLENFKDVQVDLPDFLAEDSTIIVSKFEGELNNIYESHKDTLDKGEEGTSFITSLLQNIITIFKKLGDFLINGIPLSETLQTVLFGVFFILILLSIGWLITARRIKLVFLLLPWLFLLLVLSANYFLPEGAIRGVQLLIVPLIVISGILTVLGLLYFIRRGRVRSAAMFAFFLVATLLLGLPFAVFYLFTVLLLRLLYLFVAQNLAILRSIKPGRLIFIFLKSVIYWLPLLLFVIPGNYVTNKIYNNAIDTIYDNIFSTYSIERTEDSNFQDDLNTYVDTLFAPIEGEAFEE